MELLTVIFLASSSSGSIEVDVLRSRDRKESSCLARLILVSFSNGRSLVAVVFAEGAW